MTEHTVSTITKFHSIKYIMDAVKQCRSITGTTKINFTLFIEEDGVRDLVRDFFKIRGFKESEIPESGTLDMEVDIADLTPHVINAIAFGGFQKEISQWFHTDDFKEDNYAVINGIKYKLIPMEE